MLTPFQTIDRAFLRNSWPKNPLMWPCFHVKEIRAYCIEMWCEIVNSTSEPFLSPFIYFEFILTCSSSNNLTTNSRVSKIWRRSSRSGPWRTTFCRNISRSRSTRNRKISSQSSSRDRTKGHPMLADSNHVKFILNISPWNQLHFILDIVKKSQPMVFDWVHETCQVL